MSELAIFGGQPVRTGGVPAWPRADGRDEAALLAADPMGRGGAQCDRFAERFAALCGTKYCIPVANGTVSLELILRGLDIGYGDEVILPPYTFIATMSSTVFACATPVFADIEPGTYNIDPDSVAEKITDKTRAIVAVAIGGRPCDFERLEAIAERAGVYLIVDAAQAAGARFCGRSIGKYGVAASFSCQNSKNLTCGEGGIITTDDAALYQKITAMLTPGADRLHADHRLGEPAAALLNTQFDRLPDQVARRSENAAYLDGLLAGCPFVTPMEFDSRIDTNAYHLYLLRINYRALAEHGVGRSEFLAAVQAEGLPLTEGYQPLYRFACTTSPGVRHAIGRDIDTTPLPVCDTAADLEGSWFYHSLLLEPRDEIKRMADAIDKVCVRIDELRKLRGREEK